MCIELLRLCRNMVIGSIAATSGTLSCLSSLSAPPADAGISYVTAYNWDAMSREVSNCVYGSALDEMIQLYDGNRPSMHQELPQNVRRIVYRKLDEVPALLVSGASIALQSTLRVEAVPFVPSFVQRPLAETADEHGYDLEGRKDGQDHEDLSLVIEDESTSAAQPTEQEIKAANVIRRAFLRHRARLEQRDAPTEARKAIWLRIINLYCTAAESMEWTDRSYNMLFLGPLPHAYFCLERARHYVDETKRRAMRRLTSAVHLELEEVSGRMTEARYVTHIHAVSLVSINQSARPQATKEGGHSPHQCSLTGGRGT